MLFETIILLLATDQTVLLLVYEQDFISKIVDVILKYNFVIAQRLIRTIFTIQQIFISLNISIRELLSVKMMMLTF